MTRPKEDFLEAIGGASKVVEARMMSGDYTAVQHDVSLADHLARHMELSFYEMSAGPDADTLRKSDHLKGPVCSDDVEVASMLFVETMDLFGYAIRDDYDDFLRNFRKVLEGRFEKEVPAGPSFH